MRTCCIVRLGIGFSCRSRLVLDWYRVNSAPAASDIRGNIDINGTKILDDVHKGIEKLEEKKHAMTDSKQPEAAKPADNVAQPAKPYPTSSAPRDPLTDKLERKVALPALAAASFSRRGSARGVLA